MHGPKSYAKSIHIFIPGYPQDFHIEKMRKIGEMNQKQGPLRPPYPRTRDFIPGPVFRIRQSGLTNNFPVKQREIFCFHGLSENEKTPWEKASFLLRRFSHFPGCCASGGRQYAACPWKGVSIRYLSCTRTQADRNKNQQYRVMRGAGGSSPCPPPRRRP